MDSKINEENTEKVVEAFKKLDDIPNNELVECPNFKPIKPIKYASFADLLTNVAISESMYKQIKAEYVNTKNELILTTDWEEINEDRKELGLPKLSNQSARDAYIENELKDVKNQLLKHELRYLRMKRDYEVALKYSLDVVK